MQRLIPVDLSSNKDTRITVRLSPYQDFELGNLAAHYKVSKSALIRAIVQKFIDDYYEE